MKHTTHEARAALLGAASVVGPAAVTDEHVNELLGDAGLTCTGVRHEDGRVLAWFTWLEFEPYTGEDEFFYISFDVPESDLA